jgi:hypothetical protein
MTDLSTWTPSQVDVALAEIYDAEWDLRLEMNRLGQHIDRYAQGIDKYAAGDFRFSGYTKTTLDEMVSRLTEMHDKQDALRAAMVPFQDEFVRRGGWTRAWLVDNTGGHVHRSMDCTTCFETTRFGWLPQVSGLDEDEIVAQAGESACTVCYPSAPAEVLNNPSALELPKRREERLAREAEAAERAAAKAAKSLSIDGSVVELRWTYGENRTAWKDIKTYRAAELFVVESMSYSCVPSYDVAPAATIQEVLDMMAAKKGLPVNEIHEALQAKANAKRAKRVW